MQLMKFIPILAAVISGASAAAIAARQFKGGCSNDVSTFIISASNLELDSPSCRAGDDTALNGWTLDPNHSADVGSKMADRFHTSKDADTTISTCFWKKEPSGPTWRVSLQFETKNGKTMKDFTKDQVESMFNALQQYRVQNNSPKFFSAFLFDSTGGLHQQVGYLVFQGDDGVPQDSCSKVG